MMILEDEAVTAAEHAEIKELINMLRVDVIELRNTIRGNNGNRGLITRVELLEQHYMLDNTRLEEAIKSMNRATLASEIAAEPPKKASFGTWEWFRDGIGAQIMTVIITVVVLKLVDVVVTHWNLLP